MTTKPRTVEEEVRDFADSWFFPDNTPTRDRLTERLLNLLTTRDASIRREERERVKEAHRLVSLACPFKNSDDRAFIHGDAINQFLEQYKSLTPKEDITSNSKNV